MTTSTDITMIPLSKLIEDTDNVRKTNKKGEIGELAASIKAHGLLQSLVVKEAPKGKYAVSAGGRRLRALRLLAKTGDIAKTMAIPCKIVSAEHAEEASLAENVVRNPLAAADEIEAFARLAEAGEGPEAIGARFGVSGAHVARRLKLARVSPRLIEAFRKDELDLDQLSALAFSDDHAAQEEAFFNAPEWARTPEKLKAQLAQAHVPETDKLARFVGVEAYEAAGGNLVPDLFDEDGDARWLADRDLIVQLAEAKLQPIIEEVRTEGWAFAEIAIDGVAWTQFPERVRERRRELTADEQAEQERLLALLDETQDDAETEKLEEAIDALTASGWNAEEVALAGAIITLSHDGSPKVERGLVKAGDVKTLKALRRKFAKADGATGEAGYDEAGAEDGVETSTPKPRIPAKLLDELMAHKTLALRTEIASKPDLALRLLVLGLASNALNHDYNNFSLVAVRVDRADVAKHIRRSESAAPQAIAEITQLWGEALPSGIDALWAYVFEAEQQTLLDLLAVLVAPAIELRAGRAPGVTDAICAAAGLDMNQYWKATVESYFEHVRKDVIIDALMEVNPKLDRTALDKASKKEVLGRAKRAFKGSTWLPEPLRVGVASVASETAPAAIAAE